MIQTNYVALEHPHRVIYYNGVVGLQIGSLIVTTERQDEVSGSVVEIKSHPVVSYCSTEAKKNISRISYPGVYSEAVVWDQVEQSDVTTLCAESGSIDCDDFLCEIGQGLWKRGMRHGMMKAADTALRLQIALQRFGVGVSSLPSQTNFSGVDVELRDSNVFNKKQHWIGVFLVVRDRLSGDPKQSHFTEYANKFTPADWPEELKIGKVMTNVSKKIDTNELYYDLENNPYETVCDEFWNIILRLIRPNLTKI